MIAGLRQSLRLSGGMLCMLLATAPAWSGQGAEAWHSESSDDGIHVYSRAIEGSAVRAIKAEVLVESSFDAAVALLLDASQRPRWDAICVEASLLRQISDTEDLIYVHNDLPWPVADRDMVLRRDWSIDADRSWAQIRARAADGVLAEVAGRVRVSQADGLWTVERIDASSVRITTQVHADPAGPVPDWLMNTLSVQGPYKALRAIRRLLESGDDAPAGIDSKAIGPVAG